MVVPTHNACEVRSSAIDERLGALMREAGDASDTALVAVGGYGRQELCPGSDIDVLLLHRGRRDIREVADRIWYPLWDEGLKLGHGVRTVKEALSLAANELEVATSLLDTRWIAGDEALADELATKAMEQWRRRGTRWLSRLASAVDDRHQRAGEVAFLLEPDLKEGRGGLRDVHAIHWAEATGHLILPVDEEHLQQAYDFLLAVRVEVHTYTGKGADRLLLQDQDAIAAALGLSSADELMGRVAAAARTIAWASDETWWRVGASLAGPSGRIVSRDRPLGAGLVLRDGVVELTHDAAVSDDRTVILRAGAAAATAGTRLSRAALDRLATEARGPGDPWPGAARSALVELLAAGRAAIPVIEALDQKGLLVRVLPEWEPVRSRPQRNAYHRFTVDRHLCEAAAEAARLAPSVGRPDLLLVGTLLHDIGKGYPGDHTEVGMEIVARIATRMGFPPSDVATLVELVRHHLLLPDTATRRDLEDPRTAAAVAETVGSAEVLDLLAALTEADSLATGPAAWSAWKAGLLEELVARAHAHLAGAETARPPDPGESQVIPLIEAVRAGTAVAAEASAQTVAVASRDRPGLFSRVAGTLALHGLDVLSARIWSTDDDIAAEYFEVQPTFGPPDPSALVADLERALAGRLSIEARLARRAHTYRWQQSPQAAAPARTSVTFDNEASATATVVDVRAPDAMGTLYRITRALADMDLDIRHAKVSTIGHEVVDAFYVVDRSGAKVAAADYRAEVEAAILTELSRTL